MDEWFFGCLSYRVILVWFFGVCHTGVLDWVFWAFVIQGYFGLGSGDYGK
jgi:hypothetical protein